MEDIVYKDSVPMVCLSPSSTAEGLSYEILYPVYTLK